MKARIALLCAGLLLLAGSVLAQQPPRPPHDPFAGLLFPPELVMRHQRAIELEPEQKTYIRDQIREAQLQFTELQWQLQDAAETLRSLLEQSEVDEQQVLAQLDNVLDAERQVKRRQITLMIRIKNKLTAEQQERLRELRPQGPQAPEAPPRPPY